MESDHSRKNFRKPKYYLDVRTARSRRKRRSSAPVLVGDDQALGITQVSRWVKFDIPDPDYDKLQLEVNLEVAPGIDPHLALCEWMLQKEAVRREGTPAFDMMFLTAAVMDACNLNAPLRWSEDEWRLFHIDPHWLGNLEAPNAPKHPQSDYDMLWKATEIWRQSHRKDSVIPPVILLGLLEPGYVAAAFHDPNFERYQDRFFFEGPIELTVVIDLSTKLGEQFKRLRKDCSRIQHLVLQLSGEPIRRPGRHESFRGVLIYTAREAEGWSSARIAELVFPNETTKTTEKAELKVKDSLAMVRQRIRNAELAVSAPLTTSPPSTKTPEPDRPKGGRKRPA